MILRFPCVSCVNAIPGSSKKTCDKAGYAKFLETPTSGAEIVDHTCIDRECFKMKKMGQKFICPYKRLSREITAFLHTFAVVGAQFFHFLWRNRQNSSDAKAPRESHAHPERKEVKKSPADTRNS